jgi:hypothetical protein
MCHIPKEMCSNMRTRNAEGKKCLRLSDFLENFFFIFPERHLLFDRCNLYRSGN